jgi:hypothetical protein
MRSSAHRIRDWAYLSWIKRQVCIVCEKHAINVGNLFTRKFSPSQAHHAGHRGLSQRADDRTCIPLCWTHHDRNSPHSVHTLGRKFWQFYSIDRQAIIEEMNRRYELETERAA